MKGFIKKYLKITIVLICMIIITSCTVSNEIDEVVNEPSEVEEKANNSDEITIDKQGEIELKEVLIEVKKNKYVIDDNTDVKNTIEAMVKYIGSTDSELRDDLIYQTFVRWMHKLEPEQISWMLEELLSDDKLNYRVGEVNTDSVFTRSFSALTIDIILSYNLHGKYLTEAKVDNAFNELIDYMKKEQDYRGRVEVKGWAHATAHSADLLKTLAKYDQFEDRELQEMLDVIKNKVLVSSHEYEHGEEGRMVVAVKAILKRNIVDSESLQEWINSIISYEKTGDISKDIIIESNVEDFIRELYYGIKYMEEGKVILVPIEEFLEKK